MDSLCRKLTPSFDPAVLGWESAMEMDCEPGLNRDG